MKQRSRRYLALITSATPFPPRFKRFSASLQNRLNPVLLASRSSAPQHPNSKHPLPGASFMFAHIFIPQRRKYSHSRRFCAAGLGALILAAATALAAQTGQTSLEVYANAMKQPQLSQQITELEKFVGMADSGVLKHDALEVLIWDYVRMGSTGHAQQTAADLLRTDPGNPVAIAAMPVENTSQRSNERRAARDHIQSAHAALSAMETLRKPEGMLPGDFAALRR